MGGFRFSFPACVVAGKGRLVADDVLTLRMYAFPNGIRSCEDALALLSLNDACPEHDPEWEIYFVESLANFLVDASEPAGMIDEAKAGWLMRTIASDGAIHSPLELEFMLHAMELASEVPESLSAFALDQIRLALEPEARGAYLAERPDADGVTPYDLAYIWRVLRGAMDRGRLILSPLEVMVLREIDRLARPFASHAAWRDIIATIVTPEKPIENLRSRPWIMVGDTSVPDIEVEIAA